MHPTQPHPTGGSLTRTAHRFRLLTVALTGIFAVSAAAQDITRLEVRKPVDDGNSWTTIEIHVPMSLEGFDIDNPLDPDQTRLEYLRDDQGNDLLGMHELRQRENRDRGYTVSPVLQFGGVADWSNDRDITLRITVHAVAAPDATRIEFAGQAALNFADAGEPSELQVEGVPLEMQRGSDGFDTAMGPILVRRAGSLSMGEREWHKFSVSGVENTVVDVEVIGGDDSADMPMGTSGNEFLFEDPPDTVALTIRFSERTTVVVPLDQAFSVGL